MVELLIFMTCNVLSSIDCAIKIKVENCVVEFSEVTQVLDIMFD